MKEFIQKYRAISPSQYNHVGEFGYERAARICNELGVPHVVQGDDCRLANPTKKMINDLSQRGIEVRDIWTNRLCELI